MIRLIILSVASKLQITNFFSSFSIYELNWSVNICLFLFSCVRNLRCTFKQHFTRLNFNIQGHSVQWNYKNLDKFTHIQKRLMLYMLVQFSRFFFSFLNICMNTLYNPLIYLPTLCVCAGESSFQKFNIVRVCNFHYKKNIRYFVFLKIFILW